MTDTTTESLRVPEGTRLLHIGSPKTGSTALQMAMRDSRAEMQQNGVLLAASDQPGREAVLAALMNQNLAENPRVRRRWDALLDEIEHAGEPRVCLSNESLSRIDLADARRMVNALGGQRAHVVAVVRRLDKLLPSQWQEWVRVGSTSLSYEQWLEVVLGDHPDDPSWRDFWVPHDIERLVRRWVEASASDRFSLVVADESDRRMLSRSFEQMLGLPDGLLKPEESHRQNVSASMNRVETVRRVNEALAEQAWPAEITTSLRSRVAKRIRSAAPPWPGEAPIPPLPRWAAERVRELDEQREQLARSLDVRVVGDPANLRAPDPGDAVADEPPDTVSTELAAQTIVTAIGGAVELVEQQRVQDQRTIARLRRKARRRGKASAPPGLDEVAASDLLGELRRRATRRVRHRR